MGIITVTILLLWVVSFSIHLYGVYKTQAHFEEQPVAPDTPFRLIPVTILKPLKGVDEGLSENLKSFFNLDYPEYELIFSVANEFDPATRVIRGLISEHPHVRSRLIVGELNIGKNPKVNNLIRGYESARYDWVLISDSNVRVGPRYLKNLVSQINTDTGMITSVVLGTESSGIGGGLEQLHLNTFYAKAMVLASSVGRDCVVGKSMLFHKSSADRFGGLRALGGFLAEDYMAGEAMKQLGLKVSTAWDTVPQFIGEYSLKEFLQRHIRWGRIRKAQSPIAFFSEVFSFSALPGLFLAIGLSTLVAISPLFIFLIHSGVWLLLDLFVMRSIKAKMELRSVLFWLLRESLIVPLWLFTASGSSVSWRGERYTLKLGGILVPQKV